MRRLVRRFFPRLQHPLLDASRPPLDHDVAYAAAYAATIDETDPFVTERFEEGRRWRTVLQHYQPGRRILDLGAGNGAIELAFRASPRTCATYFVPRGLLLLPPSLQRAVARAAALVLGCGGATASAPHESPPLSARRPAAGARPPCR